MKKKIFSLLGCLIPFGALGYTVTPDGASIDLNPGGNGVVGGADVITGVEIAADSESMTIVSGQGLVIGGGADSTGLNVAKNIVVGGVSDTDTANGSLFADTGVNKDNFSITSDGGIVVGESFWVVDGYSVTIDKTSADLTALPDLKVGGGFVFNTPVAEGVVVAADTKLTIRNIGEFSVSNGIQLWSGVSDIDVSTLNLMGDSYLLGASADIDVNTATFDMIISGGSNVDINATGDVSIGNLQNVSEQLVVDAIGGGVYVDVLSDVAFRLSGQSVTFSGVVLSGKNTTLVLNATNDLSVNGSETLTAANNESMYGTFGTNVPADGVTASLFTNGDTYLTAGGTITLENGWFIGSDVKNFSLVASNLSMASESIKQSSIAALLNNNMDSLVLTLGGESVGNNEIINNGATNTNANMTVSGAALVLGGVTNNATLNLSSTGASTDSINGIVITGNIDAVANSHTDITSASTFELQGDLYSGNMAQVTIDAADALNIQNVVANEGGNVKLTGNTVVLNQASNTYANAVIDISGLNGITINNNLDTTGGIMSLHGKAIVISGLVKNNGGVTNIVGLDNLAFNPDGSIKTGMITVGGVQVDDGVVNIASLGGRVDVVKDITVTNGAFNLSQTENAADVNTFTNLSVGGAMDIAGNLTIGNVAATDGGNMNVNTGSAVVLVAEKSIEIGGGFSAADDTTLRMATLDADEITIGGNVNASGLGRLILGAGDNAGTQKITTGNINATNGGIIEINAGTIGDAATRANVGAITESGAQIFARGDIASDGAITIADGVWGGAHTSGLIIRDNTELSLNTTQNIDIDGGVSLGELHTASFKSGLASDISGAVVNAGTLAFSAGTTLTFDSDVTNSGDFSAGAAGTLAMLDLANTGGNVTLSGGAINAQSIDINGGVFVLNPYANGATNSLHASNLSVYNGGAATLNTSNITIDDAFTINGDLRMGGGATCAGGVCINGNNGASVLVSGNAMSVAGDFIADALTATYDIATDVNIDGGIYVANGADVTIASPWLYAASIENRGILTTNGNGLTIGGDMYVAGNLTQNYAGTLSAGDMNIASGVYAINGANIEIGGDIDVDNIRFATRNYTDLLDITVGGDVSGAVEFMGLERLHIGGDFTITPNTYMNIIATPGGAYWADVLALGGAFAVQKNAAEPLISVGGDLIFADAIDNSGDFLTITLFDDVNTNTAIHFMNVEKQIQDGTATLDEIIASFGEIVVRFCNADGSICFDYLNPDAEHNGLNPKEPMLAWLGINDYDPHNIYILFNSIFESRAEWFRIQPVVESVPGVSKHAVASANAIDNLMFAQMENTLFLNKKPLQLVKVAFEGTPLETFGIELFNRMSFYDVDGESLAGANALDAFSRLFQPREMEQIVGLINLNEHTNFRSFEDRMIDEFIWNRNRKLKKAWAETEFGMFSHKNADDNKVTGNRFAISGGFDWQATETIILGLTGRVSRAADDNSVYMNLGFNVTPVVDGFAKTDVSDTNIGLGGYMMKTLGDKMRLYGNAFLDIHVFDITREQNFVDTIDGRGTSFAFTGEFGLLHDWLYQYVVGNAYVRAGYNTGFDITTQIGDFDYMNLKYDGYASVTPGYSLTAQKRIYTSPWFQFRPYITAGVEYDVLGMADVAQYKFDIAREFTDYDVDVSPLWANIGGGIEFLSASGVHFGIDYRYQHNDQIQLHNIRASGMYRF